MATVRFNLNLSGRRLSSNDQNQVGNNVSILLKQRFQKLCRKPDGQLILLQDYTIDHEHRFPPIQIPPTALASPFYCNLCLLGALHSFRLDHQLLHFLLQHVEGMSARLCTGGSRGFWLFVHVEALQIEVVEEDEEVEKLMKEVASRILVEKLERRQKSFFYAHNVKVGDQCAVCLEDLQEETKLTIMMPCSHIFHRSCISRWFEEQKSCPMCRREIEL